MIEKHLLKLRARDDVSAAEENLIRSLFSAPIAVPAKKTIIRAGDLLSQSTMLLEGIMCRYKDLSDGSRQITELHLAGDFVDLHSFTLKRLDHNIMALTPCVISTAAHEKLARVTEDSPHITRLYWFTTNLDAAVHREMGIVAGQTFGVGAHGAHILRTARAARHRRARRRHGFRSSDHSGRSRRMPGHDAVHMNRTLRDLRSQEIVDFRSRRVTIKNSRSHESGRGNPPSITSIPKRSPADFGRALPYAPRPALVMRRGARR